MEVHLRFLCLMMRGYLWEVDYTYVTLSDGVKMYLGLIKCRRNLYKRRLSEVLPLSLPLPSINEMSGSSAVPE